VAASGWYIRYLWLFGILWYLWFFGVLGYKRNFRNFGNFCDKSKSIFSKNKRRRRLWSDRIKNLRGKQYFEFTIRGED
jgi:hypothetical protein